MLCCALVGASLGTATLAGASSVLRDLWLSAHRWDLPGFECPAWVQPLGREGDAADATHPHRPLKEWMAKWAELSHMIARAKQPQ